MAKKPTYEELEQKVKELEKEARKRKQAQEDLRKSQEYVGNVIDSSLDMIITVDTDRHIVEFNKAAEETFGYRREEVIGTLVDILYANPQEGLTVHKTTVEQGQCVQEIFNRRKNGKVFPSLLSASLLRDAHGEVVGVMGVSREITESKRTEEDLKLHREILENMVEGVNLSDEKGIILFTNPNFDTMFGYKRGELIGKNVSVLNNFSSKENARFVAEVIKQLKTKASWFGEVSNIKKDGTSFTTYVRVSTLEVSGKVHLLSVQENITERKQAQDALRESEERFRALTENTSDWIWEVDQSGIYTYASPKVKDLLGYELEEVIGKTLFDFMPPDEAERVGGLFRDIVDSRKPFRGLENANCIG